MSKPARVDHEARRAALADCAARGLTKQQVADELGLSFWQVVTAARDYGISFAVNRSRHGGKAMRARAAARREEIARIAAGRTSAARRLPPVSDAEAERLTREWLARNQPTRCPTMACAAINNGEGFGR